MEGGGGGEKNEVPGVRGKGEACRERESARETGGRSVFSMADGVIVRDIRLVGHLHLLELSRTGRRGPLGTRGVGVLMCSLHAGS